MTSKAGEIGVRRPGVEYGPVSFAAGDAIDEKFLNLDMSCPRFVTVGECESGHRFAKELVCCQEWCQHCGQKDGISHDRRKGRWYPKGVQIDSMAYMVITIPLEIRCRYRNQTALSALGKAFGAMLQKEYGFKRGLRGWDWFGDPEEALKKGETPVYHPHYNALVDGKFLSPAMLESIKRSVAGILGYVGKVDVWYHYSDKVPRKLHWLNYVTRPTFLDWQWDAEMAVELKGFRRYQTWGKWEDEPVWDVPTDSVEAPTRPVFALLRGFCPECGGRMKWGTAIDARLIDSSVWDELGSGYWQCARPPP